MIISFLVYIEMYVLIYGWVIIYKFNEFGIRLLFLVIIFVLRLKEIYFFWIFFILQFNFYIWVIGFIDMRNGGEIFFCFWIFQLQGLIFVVGIFGFFVSCEIVDGYLYMVYDFGVGVKCV